MEELWNRFNDQTGSSHPYYPVRATLKNLQPETKEYNFEKLAKSLKHYSVSVTGVAEGEMVVGFGPAEGCVLQVLYTGTSDVRVKAESVPRYNGKYFFSPNGNLWKALQEGYFHGTAYDSPNDQKNSQWKPAGPQRDFQRESFWTELQRGDCDVFLPLGDRLPNHRDIGGDDPNWQVVAYSLPSKMVRALQETFGPEHGQQMVNELVGRPLHVHDLVTVATLAQGDTSLRDGCKEPVMQFRRGVYKVVHNIVENHVAPHLVLSEGLTYLAGGVYVRAGSKSTTTLTLLDWCSRLLPHRANVGPFLQELDHVDAQPYMTTSVYKSILQKTIRFGANPWQSGETTLPSDVVLLYCMHKLLHGLPQYNPNLRTSVQGVGNVTKRLAVIAFEDACGAVSHLPLLMGAALLSQAQPSWFPCNQFIQIIFEVGLTLLHSSDAFDYFNTVDHPVLFDATAFSTWGPLKQCACMMRMVGGMDGDKKMMDYVCRHPNKKVHAPVVPPVVFLPYPNHAFDQHTLPQVVLLLKDDIPYDDSKKKKTPFGARCQYMFRITGTNYRRHDLSNFEERAKHVREAQSKLISLYRPIQPAHATRCDLSFELPDDWLAAAIGPFPSVKTRKGQVMASLNPNDINSIVCQPSLKQRGQKEKDVQWVFEPEMQANAKKKALEILEAGTLQLTTISKAHMPIPDLYGCRVKREGNNYFIGLKGGEWKPWSEAKRWGKQYVLPSDWEAQLDQLFRSESLLLLHRALTYLHHCNRSFGMRAISRDGSTGPDSDPVDPLDAPVFKLFCAMAQVVPPALFPKHYRPFHFAVENPYLLQRVKRRLEQVVKEKTGQHVPTTWPTLEDKEGRELYGFQRKSIDQLLRSTKSCKLLVLPTGMGKTLIVLQYLAERGLGDVGHIFYTMPKSAFHSVIGEMLTMGFRVAIHLATKPSTGKKQREQDGAYRRIGVWANNRPEVFHLPVGPRREFRKGIIHVIEHDGLSKYQSYMQPHMGSSIFILDEIHKCLLYSKRSGAALCLSKLAKETIGFTGTPILNKKGTKLMTRWLEMAVQFKVTEENFVVAANSMISFSPRVEVEVREHHHVCDPGPAYAEAHRNGSFLQMVRLAQEACQREIVKVVEAERKVQLQGGPNDGQFQKVFVVAENRQGQQWLAQQLQANHQVVCIGTNNLKGPSDRFDEVDSIDLTDAKVADGRVKDYDVVITRAKYNAGYNLTRCCCCVGGVYFGNEADRQQIRGRMRPFWQKNPYVKYITVMSGLLRVVHGNYAKVKMLNACMQQNKISSEDMAKLTGESKKRKRNAVVGVKT